MLGATWTLFVSRFKLKECLEGITNVADATWGHVAYSFECSVML